MIVFIVVEHNLVSPFLSTSPFGRNVAARLIAPASELTSTTVSRMGKIHSHFFAFSIELKALWRVDMMLWLETNLETVLYALNGKCDEMQMVR